MSIRLHTPYSWGWLLFGIGCALVINFFVGAMPSAAQDEMTVFTGRSPEAVVEQFLNEDKPEGLEVGIVRTSQAGDYAISTYYYGEGGGFVVVQRTDRQWQNICADGGAPDGADFVNICKVPLEDAQALWDKYLADGENLTPPTRE
ncbi:MAG: hypothetical protein ACFB0G_10080 [Leptolyngbyaceae cyanobacterium]